MRTEYFSNCRAVFEGGGVRGSAYAGAYAAAVKAGIRFNSVAGSSAGSIVAAFIAAGGSPDDIKEKLLGLDMSSLQRPVKKDEVPFLKSGISGAILSRLPSEFAQKIGKFICYSGSFSSNAVRDWVEECLRAMLTAQGGPQLDRPVRFSDLRIPLYVVAADVLQRGPKVWSLDTTPEDSVAFAVQASCAIPFHFQAVINAQSVFVDGGTISNLPSHVFPPHKGHPGRFAEKTLAFRLRADSLPPKMRFDDATDFALNIADTVVSSSTLIQQSLQSSVYPIEIYTGDVRSTDFDKMNDKNKAFLLSNGKQAVEDFVAREREVVGRHQLATRYEGFDERLLAYVFAISTAKDSIWFSDSSTYWLFFIYPVIASALARGVNIKVVLQDPPPKDVEIEVKRRVRLASLGCDVVQVKSLAFTGLLVDYPSVNSIAVISSENGVVGQDFDYTKEQVRLYYSDDDLPVIRNLGEALVNQVGTDGDSNSSQTRLSIISLQPADLFAGLKRVWQYVDASFSIEDIPLDKQLRISQTHIKEFKLLQIESLVRDLERSGFDFFAPCQYSLPDGSSSIITPPIIEMTRHGPVIIEGHVRAYYMNQLGRDRFRAVVVSNVHEGLPVTPRAFSELRIAEKTMTETTILPNLNKNQLRHIEAALHP